ncbi:hypothetical protein PF010_g25899, partial [Phytophthora fragariae]
MADVQPPESAPDAAPSDATASNSIANDSSPPPAIGTSSSALEASQTVDIESIQVPTSAPSGDVNDPATYKRSQDPNWKNTGLDDIYATWDKLVPVEEL